MGGRRGDPQATPTLPRTGSAVDPGQFSLFPVLTEERRLAVHDWTRKTTVLPDLLAPRGGRGGGGVLTKPAI